jgi:predicted amidohydrolase YtcJ
MKLIRNAHLWLNNGFSQNKMAILIDNEIIQDIIEEPINFMIDNVESIDMNGAYVYPGFIDTHTHSFEGGLYSLGVDLSEVKCIDDVLVLLDAKYQHTSADEVIFAWQFDENAITEKRFPTMSELDSVVPSKSIVLRRVDGHSCILNSYARKIVSGVPAGIEILRAEANDYAVHHFHNSVREDVVLNAYHQAADIAMRGGFTGIHTMVGDANQSIGHYSLIDNNISKFKISFTLYPQSFNIRAALNAGATRIGGCILADGSIGSHTAALSQPYEGTVCMGSLYHDDSFWHKFISEAHKNNLQVGVHCIGDKAIAQINSVFNKLKEEDYRDLRHQLIHCEITDDNLVASIANSGAVPVMQPSFDLLWGGDNGFYSRQLGLDRARNMNRFGTFYCNNVRVTGSSDWYITPLNIVQSIRAAMLHKNEAERLTHAEAVDLYTRNAAWLSHEESILGIIAKGYRADFSILDNPIDDLSTNPEVKMIISKGDIVYAAN